VNLRGVTLGYLLTTAFQIQQDQVKGPAWLFSQRYDVAAVAPLDTPKDNILLMFQRLLADRFGLQYHRQTTTQAVYSLVAGPEASKLPAGIPDKDGGDLGPIGAASGSGVPGSPLKVAARTLFGIYRLSVVDRVNRYEFENISMLDLARSLSTMGRAMLGAPVVDATNLPGRYQVWLVIPQSEMHGGAAGQAAAAASSDAVPVPADPPGTSMRASLEKQGLRLVRRNSPVDTFVVDRIDKTPTAN
jgi:uncharacterized protein (TIGR03435 family)